MVGVGADTQHPDEWQAGLTIWIAVDDISTMTVFPTIEALRKHAATIEAF